jgi:hypothetical protein
MRQSTRAMLDNRSRQLNPSDVRYQESRGNSPSKGGSPPADREQGRPATDEGRGGQGRQR